MGASAMPLGNVRGASVAPMSGNANITNTVLVNAGSGGKAIQVVNAANGKAILAHPTGQLLRQVRPVALPTNVSLTGQAIQPSASINPATSVIITTPQSNPQASSTITTMSLVNNPNIRLRLPDTPTTP